MLTVNMLDATNLFKSREEIVKYNQTYVTDDPSIGWVNIQGVIEDIMDSFAIENMSLSLKKSNSVNIIYGIGFAIRQFKDLLDIICFVDNTHQKVKWDI